MRKRFFLQHFCFIFMIQKSLQEMDEHCFKFLIIILLRAALELRSFLALNSELTEKKCIIKINKYWSLYAYIYIILYIIICQLYYICTKKLKTK